MRLFFASLAVAFLTASVGSMAMAADAPKDAIQIDACKAKKAAVTFEHSKHAEFLLKQILADPQRAQPAQKATC